MPRPRVLPATGQGRGRRAAPLDQQDGWAGRQGAGPDQDRGPRVGKRADSMPADAVTASLLVNARRCADCAARTKSCVQRARSSPRPRCSSHGRPVTGELASADRGGEATPLGLPAGPRAGVAGAGDYPWASRHRLTATSRRACWPADREIHDRSRGSYGGPGVPAELRLGLAIGVGRTRVARIMREHSLQGIQRRRRGGLTRPDPQASPAPDLVERDFTRPGPTGSGR